MGEIVEYIVLYVGQTTLLKRIYFVLYKTIWNFGVGQTYKGAANLNQ